MKAIAAWLAIAASSVHANISRTGNVIYDDSPGGSEGFGTVIGGIVAGAIAGAIYAKYQQSKGQEFATDGGAIIGGLIGMFASPLLMLFLR